MSKDETKKAAAIRYNPNKDRAPRLVAKGAGYLAEKIIEVAQRYDIPIKEDGELVKALNKLQINVEIPVELYGAMAEVLAFLYATDKKAAEKYRIR